MVEVYLWPCHSGQHVMVGGGQTCDSGQYGVATPY